MYPYLFRGLNQFSVYHRNGKITTGNPMNQKTCRNRTRFESKGTSRSEVSSPHALYCGNRRRTLLHFFVWFFLVVDMLTVSIKQEGFLCPLILHKVKPGSISCGPLPARVRPATATPSQPDWPGGRTCMYWRACSPSPRTRNGPTPRCSTTCWSRCPVRTFRWTAPTP